MPEQLRHQLGSYHVQGVHVRNYLPPPGRARYSRPVVFVHGGNHTGKALGRYARELSEHGYDCHVLDWYNHGESFAWPTEQFVKRGIPQVACAEIDAVVSTLGEDPILIGHSMGGLASLLYAAHRWVDKLVLIAPTPNIRIAATPLSIDLDWSEPFGPPPFEEAKALFWQGLTDEQARPPHEDLVRESPLAVAQAIRYTEFADLEAVKRPVLCMAAGLDTLYPPDTTSQLADLIPDGEFALVKDAGHSDILMKPDVWQHGARHIVAWLQSHEDAA